MKVIKTQTYICSVLLICFFTSLLNFCTAIYQCALVFTVIAIATNTVTFLYGKSRSLKGIVFAIIISFVFLMNLPYHIDGKIINGLICVSFSSLMISMYCSVSIFQKLIGRFNFIVSNALSLISAAIIDGVIMGIFFTFNTHFSYLRILDIFGRELSYKMMYAFTAFVIMYLILKMSKNMNLSFNLNK